MKIKFTQLITPTIEIVDTIIKWDNDPELRPLIRPNKNQNDINNQSHVTVNSLLKRLKYCSMYLMYLDEKLVGQMSFQIGFDHLYKNEPNTAWIGMGIGESHARGKGIGSKALVYLEEKIKQKGIHRIELGVFTFNKPAHNLYKTSGYQEIGRIDNFTYFQGKMWPTIHMEKYLG